MIKNVVDMVDLKKVVIAGVVGAIVGVVTARTLDVNVLAGPRAISYGLLAAGIAAVVT